MMKAVLSIAALALTALAAGSGWAGDEGSWFDLENCAMCKHLMTDPAMMENLGWENHLTMNGMMSVTIYRTEGAKAYFADASTKMEEVGQKLMAGEQMPLCNYCQSFGKLLMTGKVTLEEFETETGQIMLVSSDDPAVVKMIHEHGQHTIDEFAKYESGEAAAECGSPKHDHDKDHGHDHKDNR
jgi:hypothetical protein